MGPCFWKNHHKIGHHVESVINSVGVVIGGFVAIIGSIVIPLLFRLVGTINKNTEELVELKACIRQGLEPRVRECEQDIGHLYTRTNRHDMDIAVLQQATKHT
jgi:hypothetical protein